MTKFSSQVTIVWDLMDTADGVKILEFQQEARSGLTGYKKAYGESLRDKIDQYTGTKWNNRYICKSLLKEICDNKNMMASFVEVYSPHLFPRQKVYAYSEQPYSRQQILHDFPNTDSFVFKEAEKAIGEGVHFVSREELEEGKLLSQFFKYGDELTQYPDIGHFLVQEGLRPNTIEVNGEIKYPTIRLVATITPHERGEIEWEFHGAYYKIPENSASNSFKIASSSRSQILSSVKKGGSVKLDEEDYSRICFEMQSGLTPFFDKLSKTDDMDFIREGLKSQNIGNQISSIIFIRKQERDFERLPADIKTTLAKKSSEQVHIMGYLYDVFGNKYKDYMRGQLGEDIYSDLKKRPQFVNLLRDKLEEEYNRQAQRQIEKDTKELDRLNKILAVSSLEKPKIGQRKARKLRRARQRKKAIKLSIAFEKENIEKKTIPNYVSLSRIISKTRSYGQVYVQ